VRVAAGTQNTPVGCKYLFGVVAENVSTVKIGGPRLVVSLAV
jgi:hypothetical protein